MPRYIEGPEVRLTENDKIFVDAEFYTGEKFTELELHRMFPITGLTKYIALMDSEGNEIKREELCKSNYNATPQIIEYGVM